MGAPISRHAFKKLVKEHWAKEAEKAAFREKMCEKADLLSKEVGDDNLILKSALKVYFKIQDDKKEREISDK